MEFSINKPFLIIRFILAMPPNRKVLKSVCPEIMHGKEKTSQTIQKLSERYPY